MCCTRATWTKFVTCTSELGPQCFFQNWSHTRFCCDNWYSITNFEVDSIVETDTSVSAVFKPVWHFCQIFLWLFYFHHFFEYFYCIFPSILTLGTQYPQNRDIWKRPVVRHLKMKSEHFWSPVWFLETKYTKWRNKITHSDWLCTRQRWSPTVPRKSMILEPFLSWSTFSEIE